MLAKFKKQQKQKIFEIFFIKLQRHLQHVTKTDRKTLAISIFLFIFVVNHTNSGVLCNTDVLHFEEHSNFSENIQKKPINESLASDAAQTYICEAKESSIQVWSQFLEDYVLSQSSSRTPKNLPFEMSGPGYSHMQPHMGGAVSFGSQQNQLGPINYHSSAYKRPGMGGVGSGIYVTRRIGEAAELEPHLRKPVETPVVNPQFRPMTNQMLHQQQQQQRQTPGFLQQLFGFGGGNGGGGVNGVVNAPPPPPVPVQQQQLRPVPLQQPPHHIAQHGGIGSSGGGGNVGGPQTFRAVSENDLYLLGAIEKLVYRVDYLESRIRRAEQLIYYLMAGNNQKEVRDPCPTNFTRINENCYYINSHQQVNWKTANSACKALNAHLAEFERVSENEEIMAYLLNQPNHRGRDYWLGGLNPGLLWIWSNSAKPVNPNMNLTSIAMSQNQDNATASNLVDSDNEDESDTTNGNNKETETILNNIEEIKGQGRCLRLSYNLSKHSYTYYGQECTSRHHYICESEDKTLDNKIKKITRELKLFN